MNKEVILVIVEGEKTEPKVIENIKKLFFNDIKKPINLLSYKTDIYNLYNKLKQDDFETEIIDLLIEKNADSSDLIKEHKNNISQTYLFFDYDGQAQINNQYNTDTCISEMLELFNNETEFGKLYISYPMVEVVKDFKDNDSCNRRCVVKAKENISYKKLVHEESSFHDITTFTKNYWIAIIIHMISKLKWVMSLMVECGIIHPKRKKLI